MSSAPLLLPPEAALPPPLGRALDEFAKTDVARTCARPAGAYANCLAASTLCARWLRQLGFRSGLLHLSGTRVSLEAAVGRWPYYDPAQLEHWTVRAGSWSIDWTARQFSRGAAWPAVEPVAALADRWGRVDDWACDRCPELVADERHVALAPASMHREHRLLARASEGRGPFRDPRHDGSAPLVRLCACSPVDPGAQP